MPWPTVAVVTTGMDADTDTLPRADILDHTNKFNQLIAMRGVANGVCELDSAALVPTTKLPGQLATLSGMTATQATDLAATSAFMGTVLNDISQGAALTTLGAPLQGILTVSTNHTINDAYRGSVLDCTGTLTHTLTAAATLGVGFGFAVRNSGTGVITIDPDAAELIDGAATVTFGPGESGFIVCNGTAWKTIGRGAGLGFMHVRDEKVAGTDAGSSVAGSQIRTLNTVVTNTIAGASLATNQITLPAGTYRVIASAPCLGGGRSRARLVNVTDATVALLGTSEFGSSADTVQTSSTITGRIAITAAKAFNVTHYIELAKASNGLGATTLDTFADVYTSVMIWKE